MNKVEDLPTMAELWDGGILKGILTIMEPNSS
jgi:hypothetical protein